MSFYMANGNHTPYCFDVDNVTVGTGADFDPPQAVANLKVNRREDAVQLAWSAGAALGGVREFRVYRGLNVAFGHDPERLIGVVTQPSFDDTFFTHNGDYFYCVRAVDFAGQEGNESQVIKATIGGP